MAYVFSGTLNLTQPTMKNNLSVLVIFHMFYKKEPRLQGLLRGDVHRSLIDLKKSKTTKHRNRMTISS